MTAKYCYDHPRPAVSVDSVLLSRDGYILLVKRKSAPFQGCWALPGGFVDIDETLADAAARELAEETGLTDVEMRELGAFDKPDRDPRGRTISVAFLAVVDRRAEPVAGDDAADARWTPVDKLPPMAFDHDQIIAAARQAAAVDGAAHKAQ